MHLILAGVAALASSVASRESSRVEDPWNPTFANWYPDVSGNTALGIAAYDRRYDAANLLLIHGTDPSPLELAKGNRYRKLAALTGDIANKHTPASFDCGKAKTRVELLICSNESLSELDRKLAEAYRAALTLDGGDAVKRGQRDWLKARNECNTAECIQGQYSKRLSELEEFSKSTKVPVWEPMNVANLPYPDGRKYYSTFMTRESLDKTGSLRSIKTLTNYFEPQSFRNDDHDFVDYRSVISLEYVDCARGRMATAQDDFFSDEMGGGELVRSEVYSESTKTLRWEATDLGGIVSSNVRVVCGL